MIEEKKEDKGKKVKGFIRVYKITYHKGCPVYIRRIGWKVWEYLTVIENQIYTSHYIFYPRWYKTLFKNPYSKVETHGILGMLSAAAQATIETVKEMKEDKLKEDKKKKK